MITFAKLTRDEGSNVREEWVNAEAIDTLAAISDCRTSIRFRHGGQMYVSESPAEIIARIRKAQSPGPVEILVQDNKF